jgi:hypothetical protein
MTEKKKSSRSSHGISRREFARRAAWAAAGVAVIPDHLLPASEALAMQQPVEPKLSPEGRAEVEAKVQAIFRKYGQRLSEEQKADLQRLVTEGQKSLESLRAFPLDNADQPATVFEIYPEAHRGERPARGRGPQPASRRAKKG